MPASEVFHKWATGKLHSGSKSGPPVKSHAQAIAIYLSEKRKEAQHGGKYPEKQMGGPVGMGMPPGMGGMMPGLGGQLPPSMPPSSMSPMLQGFRAEGGHVSSPPLIPDVLQGQINQAFGAGTLGPFIMRQARPQDIPPPKSSMDKIWDNYAKNMSEAEFLRSEPLWSGAQRMSEQTGIPVNESFANIANEMASRRRSGQTLSSDDALRVMGGQQLNSLLKLPDDSGNAHGGAVGLGYQFGGSPTSMGLTPGWIERSEARNIGAMSRPHLGPIVSTVGGRTDNHAISVPSGSYVFPAAHVSAIGQGNTLNGLKVLQGMFGPPMHGGGGRLPMGRPAPMLRPMAGGMPKGAPFASSGKAPFTSAGGSRGDAHVGKPVDIMAAGGEFVLGPDQVMRGPIDKPWNLPLDKAHAVLDHWVKKKHKEWGKTVTNLPPPAKS